MWWVAFQRGGVTSARCTACCRGGWADIKLRSVGLGERRALERLAEPLPRGTEENKEGRQNEQAAA